MVEDTDLFVEPGTWMIVLPIIPLTIYSLFIFGVYRSLLRFITTKVFKAVTFGAVISAASLYFSINAQSLILPKSLPIIYFILFILFSCSVRLILRDFLSDRIIKDGRSIAIYGAGEAGRQLQKALFQGREYSPKAFIDDNGDLQNTLVGGTQVFSLDSFVKNSKKLKINLVLLAIPSTTLSRRSDIISELKKYDIEVKTIPGMDDIVSGKASFKELRNITLDELLGRETVNPKHDLMAKNVTGKVVLVSGAGGSIGSELCRQILNYKPKKLILLEVSEFLLYQISNELAQKIRVKNSKTLIQPLLGSVQNPGRVAETLKAFNVQTIYHAAAYKHVIIVEENVVEGLRNNVFGTKIMVDAAAAAKVENFILISTDKAVRPSNIMGCSKRLSELICQAKALEKPDTNFSMVRFGNVLGSSGSVIPLFEAQIENGGPVTVTHEKVTRYFMTIQEAAQLVIQAGAMAKGGDLFLLDMGKPVKILELAKDLIWLKGLKPYVIDPDQKYDFPKGDIGIKIIGLQKGEKLFEELLIGNQSYQTDHPKILTAEELSLSPEDLSSLLQELKDACTSFDIEKIQKSLLKAPLDYMPTNKETEDLLWQAAKPNSS